MPPRALIAAYYFLLFGGVGITLPYLPQHFRSLGFAGGEIGLLAAIGPAMSLIAPPLWGYFSDRTRRPALLLTITGIGVIAGNAVLSTARAFGGAAGALALTGIFSAPQTVLIDTVAIEHVRREGGGYSRLRLWGSLGFVSASFWFGRFYRGDPEEVPRVVLAALGFAMAYTVVSLFIRSQAIAKRPHLSEALALLTRRDLLVLYSVACLHWIACAPYNVFFIVHTKAIGIPPSVSGAAMALGVVAEVTVMAVFPSIEGKVPLRTILASTFAASAVRWWATGSIDSWPVIAGVQVLHGLTFGAFYVACITYLARSVPAHLRASGQSLFVASAFGVGGMIGYLASGHSFDALGGAVLFRYAALVELLPLGLSFLLAAKLEAP